MPSNVAVETRFLNIAGSLGRVCFRMKTGQRGILLGGWAEMSAAALEGEEDSQELLAYCKDSRAAQEWMTWTGLTLAILGTGSSHMGEIIQNHTEWIVIHTRMYIYLHIHILIYIYIHTYKYTCKIPSNNGLVLR